MIERERHIASLFSIVVGLVLLVLLPNLLSTPAPDTAPDLTPESRPIDAGHLGYTDQVCEDIRLRNPGGMTYNMALVCIHEEMEVIINADHLTRDQYNQIIQPVVDSLTVVAVEKGIRKKSINMWAN